MSPAQGLLGLVVLSLQEMLQLALSARFLPSTNSPDFPLL